MESVMVNLKPFPALGQTVPPKHYKTQYQNTHRERERERWTAIFFSPDPLHHSPHPPLSNCITAVQLFQLYKCVQVVDTRSLHLSSCQVEKRLNWRLTEHVYSDMINLIITDSASRGSADPTPNTRLHIADDVTSCVISVIILWRVTSVKSRSL